MIGSPFLAGRDRYEAMVITDDGRVVSTAGFGRYRIS